MALTRTPRTRSGRQGNGEWERSWSRPAREAAEPNGHAPSRALSRALLHAHCVPLAVRAGGADRGDAVRAPRLPGRSAECGAHAAVASAAPAACLAKVMCAKRKARASTRSTLRGGCVCGACAHARAGSGGPVAGAIAHHAHARRPSCLTKAMLASAEARIITVSCPAAAASAVRAWAAARVVGTLP